LKPDPDMNDTSVTIGVTGATGFIGRHLVSALRRDGAQVRALTRRIQPTPNDDLPGTMTWVLGALDDEAALKTFVEGCDAVIHLAGAIKALSRDEFLYHNARGTLAIAQTIAAMREPARLISVSSLAAREPRLSNYALSKREGEKALRAFSGRVSFSIVRPPAVYGPGDLETLRIFQMAARGFVVTPPSPSARLSLIHVEDLVSAILNLIPVRDDPGEPLEIDDGQPGGYDWPGVVAAASEALQVRPRIIPLPAAALYAAGAVGSLLAKITGKSSTLSWDKVPELLHPNWVAQGASIAGWQPRWNLRNGFKNTVSSATSQGLLKSYS
jgi:2-alkyl-3-oxoalkanoate reductase